MLVVSVDFKRTIFASENHTLQIWNVQMGKMTMSFAGDRAAQQQVHELLISTTIT